LPRFPVPFLKLCATCEGDPRDGPIRAIIAATAPHAGDGWPKAPVEVEIEGLPVVVIAGLRPQLRPKFLMQTEADQRLAVAQLDDLGRADGDHGGLREVWAADRIAVAEAVAFAITDMPIDQFCAL